MRLFRRGETASTLDLLVAGLGNPGREHERDRHNVGWMVVDELARRHGGTWKSKFNGRLAETRIGESRVALLKPETYMNESGRSIGGAARFFKVSPDALLVVHDDVDLELCPASGPGGGWARRSQRTALDLSVARDTGVPPVADRGRETGARRPAPGRRLRAVAVRARRGSRRAGLALGRRGRGDSRRRSRGRAAALQLTSRVVARLGLGRSDRDCRRRARASPLGTTSARLGSAHVDEVASWRTLGAMP